MATFVAPVSPSQSSSGALVIAMILCLRSALAIIQEQ
jgi:hypothetical protein